MPRCTRVTPLGEFVDRGRGLVFGNRGCLHDAGGELRRPFRGKRWIACRLDVGGRRRELLQPGRYTELFFLDEATAFAAGHRPCRACRRRDYEVFVTLWRELHPGDERGADAVDARLHDERIDPSSRRQRHVTAPFEALPEGAFVVAGGKPFLVLAETLLRWTPEGYAEGLPRPSGGEAEVVTPPSLLRVLAAGWAPEVPLVHPSAVAVA